MINLLPPEEKEELLKDRKWKIVTILSMLFLLFLVCLSLILYSIITFIAGTVEAQTIVFSQKEEELNSSRNQALQKSFTSFNRTVSQIDSFYGNYLNFTEVLEKISQSLPNNLYLTSLSLTPTSTGKEKIDCNLSGFSPFREVLLEFKGRLEKEETFNGIYFPPANWVEANDINFSVNFKVR